MIIQIIEDDFNKLHQITDFIKCILPSANIVQNHSYQSGLKSIIEKKPELIILDMSLPTYDLSSGEPGGTFRYYGGRDILRNITRKKIKSKVIVVTMYEKFGEGHDALSLSELKKRLKKDFEENYIGTIFYQPSTIMWQNDLKNYIENFERQM
ncbi:MAG: hypothetical protein ACIAQZ_12445 [Sedimentisphaeraceae bacterium JB056]